MAKIQKLNRKDRPNPRYSVYLPKSELEAAGIEQGDEVTVIAKEKGKIELVKE